MKLKFVLSTLILVFVSFVAFSQLSLPVLAHHKPISSPISSALITLSGWVKYLNHFHFDPAQGAVVMAKNKNTNELFSATADSSGKYMMSVPKGKYHVWAEGVNGFANDKFVPNISSLKLLFDFQLNFFGLPKH